VSSVDELVLAGEFPAASRERWERLALRALGRDGDVDELLGTPTYDGLRLRPLYTAADGAAPWVHRGRPVGRAWEVRQRHAHPVANREVLADLENGAGSLWLCLDDPDRLPAALDGVYLDLAGLVLDAGEAFEPVADAYLALLADRGLRPGQARGNLGADPLAAQARTGQRPDLAAAVELAGRCLPDPGALRAITVDALPYHEAGGSDAQELACSIAAGTSYLRALVGAGLSVEQACGQLEFRYAATADQFATIAKLRAARRLWQRVTAVCGGPAVQRQHAVTSPAMQTVRDPWVNLLRTTVACFAAGVGGADAVTVLPFDSAGPSRPIGLPDTFARRIARNTQSLLLDEAHAARVTDPAAGSWYVESLTEELARRAWTGFQRIEAAGGLSAALADGSIADDLAAVWTVRRENLAHRRDPLTGVSEFPNLAEKPLVRAPAGPGTRPAQGGLPVVRYAEEYERLRDASDAILAETGSRPRVFLATLGPPSAHAAMASFAANLFQAGGFETISSGVTDPLAAYADAGAPPVACLCSSDAVYAERAAEVVPALRAAGARAILVASGDSHPYRRFEGAKTSIRMRDDLGAGGDLGVAGVVFPGCDAIGVLTGLYRELRVTEAGR